MTGGASCREDRSVALPCAVRPDVATSPIRDAFLLAVHGFVKVRFFYSVFSFFHWNMGQFFDVEWCDSKSDGYDNIFDGD